MARQIINIGNAPNDGSGDKLRDAFNKINANFLELYTSVEALQAQEVSTLSFMRLGHANATGTVGQVITFSEEFATGYEIFISDPNNCVIAVTATSATGFTITSLQEGEFSYLAIVQA